MIITKEVEIKISSSNYKYYKELGYDVKKDACIIVKVSDLTKGSKVYLDVICFYCYEIKKSNYKNYLNQTKILNKYSCNNCAHIKKIETVRLKYGVDYTMQLKDIKEKRNNTNIIKYGGKSPFSSEEIRIKSKKTLDINYNVDNPFKSIEIINKIKISNIKNGKWASDLNYKTYRRKVTTLTNKIRKKLLEEWDGIDYYDGEYIVENLSLSFNDRNFPTIDHKISVLYGFINNIPPEDISNIENLCITKRYINSKKSNLTEHEFKTT